MAKVSSNRLDNYYKMQYFRVKDVLTKKNNFFCFSLFLLSVMVMIITWIIESNINGVENNIFDNINVSYIYLIITTMIFIPFLSIVIDYLFIFKKLKKRRFSSILGGHIVQVYYNNCCFFGGVGNFVFLEYLNSSNIDDDFAKDMVSVKTLANKISNLVYSLLALVIGSIFVLDKTNILLYVLSIIIVIVGIFFILGVFCFNSFKEKYLIFFGRLCKFLYKHKIIKNYEKVYNNMVAKIMYYGSALKVNKGYLVVNIVIGFIKKLLKHTLLYFVVCMFGISESKLYVEVLFKCSIFDLIIGLFLLPGGVFVFELIFLALFRNVFFDGYVLYAMVIYRIITYFISGIVFGLGYVLKIRKRLNEIKNSNKYIRNE